MLFRASRTLHHNRLLSALSLADLRLLQPHLETVTLPVRRILEEPNEPIKTVYFLEAGIASVVAGGTEGSRVEIGLIGREGMSGLPVVLGNHRSPHSTYAQVAGQAQCITTSRLRRAMQKSATMRSVFLKFVQTFMTQTAHTAISNARAKLDERLARWILMADDRIEDHKLPLTHEFLSLMLGVRRAGVTEALQVLERRGLIRSQRGEILVLNRKGIERSAGDCYGVPEAEYRRLIG
jgi:CRP-like cAMP-binding protein